MKTELWSGRPDGTELVRHIDLGGPLPGSPAWSPDGQHLGQHLAYDAEPDGHADLWLVDRDSRRSQRLTDDPSEERNATFSCDGRHLYFASNRNGDLNIWRMPATGGEATQVTTAGCFLAQESPDGRLLCFAQLEAAGIWRMPGVGGEAEPVVLDLDLSDWGSWVVGEEGIFFVRREPTTIAYLDFDEAQASAIFTPPRQMPYLGRALSLSPNGRSLLSSMIDHSDDELMLVELAGL